MSSVWANAVAETTITGGTGPLTLLGIVPGAVGAFASLGDGWTGQVTIIEVDANGAPTGGGTEVCTGTYSLAANTISRGVVESSTNGGMPVNFASGTTKRVSVELTAAQIAAFGLIQAVTLGGNTTGTLALVTAGTLFLAGGPNVTLSQNGQSVSISAGTAAAAPINFSAGTTSGNIGSVVFSNSGGVSFGLNGSTVTATVATNYQSQGNYLTTAMQSNAATISNINVSAGTTSSNVSAITFGNSNGVSFGYDGTKVTATVATNYQTQGNYLTTAMQSGASTQFVQGNANFNGTNASGTIASNAISVSVAAQSIQPAVNAAGISNTGNTAGNTGTSSGITFVLAASNNITASQSTAGGGPNTWWLSGPTLTQYLTTADLSQNSSLYVQASAAFHGTNASGTINSNNISVSVLAQSNQTLSMAATSNTAGNTSGMSVDARSLTFAGYGAASVGYSTSAGGSTVVLSVPAVVVQTNQSGNVYASSNTFGTSSGTYDARSLSIAGSGAVNVAASNSGWVICSKTRKNCNLNQSDRSNKSQVPGDGKWKIRTVFFECFLFCRFQQQECVSLCLCLCL